MKHWNIAMRDSKQYVEIFHLLFLSQLSQRLDKHLYALKGGCNLRFYFNSIRYSEDMDLDIRIVQMNTLQNKIDRILDSIAFINILKSFEIQIDQISAPKQTKTVQRWKIALKTPITKAAIPTKIEFSRRNMEDGFIFTAVDRSLLATYQLPPVLSNHYTKAAMWLQKILALAHRTQTQARDIFDLYLLMEKKPQHHNMDPIILEKACKNIDALNYEDYKSQVIAYLLPEYQSQFDTPDIWQQIVTQVRGELI